MRCSFVFVFLRKPLALRCWSPTAAGITVAKDVTACLQCRCQHYVFRAELHAFAGVLWAVVSADSNEIQSGIKRRTWHLTLQNENGQSGGAQRPLHTFTEALPNCIWEIPNVWHRPLRLLSFITAQTFSHRPKCRHQPAEVQVGG